MLQLHNLKMFTNFEWTPTLQLGMCGFNTLYVHVLYMHIHSSHTYIHVYPVEAHVCARN